MTNQTGINIPNARNIFALSWPMTLKAVFLHGTVAVDGYLVSSLGETSLAAMGLAAAIAGMVLGVIFAFSHAVQIRTAQAFGSDDQVFLKSIVASGLTISVTLGIVGIAVILPFGQNILGFMAPNDEVAALSWSYLKIFLIVIIGESIGQTLSSYFNGCGRTRIPLAGYLLSFPINVISSIILIHGLLGLPEFGLAGAAMGSALAISVQTLFFVFRLYTDDRHVLQQKGWRQTDFIPTVKRHLIFALPIAATFVSAVFANHVCSLIFARMDLYSFAALTLIAPWNMVLGQIGMQWTQATGIFVAQLLGKRAPVSVLDKFLSTAWRGAFVMAGIMSLGYLVLNLSINFLYDDLTTETRAILLGFLPILLISSFFRNSNAICGNTLRASGDTIYVMHIFVWSQWLFRVPATAILVLYFDASAFWVLSLWLWEEVIKMPAFHRRLWKGRWKTAVIKD